MLVGVVEMGLGALLGTEISHWIRSLSGVVLHGVQMRAWWHVLEVPVQWTSLTLLDFCSLLFKESVFSFPYAIIY